MNKTVVIYHRADFDGIFCREIAKKFLGNEGVEYIGWDYGDPTPAIQGASTIYMLDISVAELMGVPGLIWIDHHKSAIEKFSVDIAGYRIDGVAACRLAWQWFAQEGWHLNRNVPLPDKQAFVDRTVDEPLAVRLAGEYDIWDKRDLNADLFQHGLRSRELDAQDWEFLLTDDDDASGLVEDLLGSGKIVQFVQTQQNKSIIKAYGFTFQWEGLTFLACNHARFNSHLFTAGIRPEHEALFGFNYDGTNGTWRVSLYHAPGHEQHDLSLIASKYGGADRRGACGFRTHKLPFTP
jgi:hypothetical protein